MKDKGLQKISKEFNEIEIFKDIYINEEKTKYQISNKGRLKSLNFRNSGKEGFMNPKINKDGHYACVIYHNGKHYYVRIHRLIAIYFIPNPENKEEVHHKNGIPFDNRIDNLQWVTSEEHKKLTKELDQYSHKYGELSPTCVYSDDQVENVLKLLSENKLSMHEIERITGVPYYVIQFIRYRENSRKNLKEKYDISGYNVNSLVKYSKDQIKEVCSLLETKSHKDKEISLITGVNYSVVKAIRLKKRWKKISKNYNF